MPRTDLASILTVLITCFCSLISPSPSLAQQTETRPLTSTPLALVLLGRVIDDETEQPVSGMDVRVHRELIPTNPAYYPDWPRDKTFKTDAQGRFKVTVPADQVTNSFLRISIHLDHPDYTPVETGLFSPYVLGYWRQVGGHPSLELVRLARRRDYTLKVLRPDGHPSVGSPFKIWSYEASWSPMVFRPGPCTGKTDTEGLVHSWIPRDSNRWPEQYLIIVWPKEECPAYTYWSLGRKPTRRAPPSLPTEVKVPPGQKIRGRLVGINNRPLANQWLTAQNSSYMSRSTQTNVDGSFEFAPLPFGEYRIDAGRHDLPDQPLSSDRSELCIEPVSVVLNARESPQPILVNEVPTTTIEVKQLDASGQPFVGEGLELRGWSSASRTRMNANLPDNVFELTEGERRRHATTDQYWAVGLAPNPRGITHIRVPVSLESAQLFLHYDKFPGWSSHVRKDDDPSSQPFSFVDLGTIGSQPHKIEIVYEPATLFVVHLVSKTAPVPTAIDMRISWESGGKEVTYPMEWMGDHRRYFARGSSQVDYHLLIKDARGRTWHDARHRLPPGPAVHELTFDVSRWLEPPDDSDEEVVGPDSNKSNYESK